MKQYKHKKLWWIAKEIRWWMFDITEEWNTLVNYSMPFSLIIDSNDREEIKEEDWIDKSFNEYTDGPSIDRRREEFRDSINKYLPRITDDMIEKMYKQCFATPTKEYFIEIIKQNLPKDLLANPN